MQMHFRRVVLASLIAALPSAAAAGDLKFSLANGRATIVATDVPLRDILAEWARVGHTTVVNGDKLVGTPVTLQLVDVPEEQALETLLRSASGYVVAQRATYTPGVSRYDRILIMPASTPPAVSASTAPPLFGRPARPMPQPQPMIDDEDPPDAPVVMPPGMNPGNPAQQTPGMPDGQPVNQAPVTSPRPGILPAPPAGLPTPTNPYVRPTTGPGGGRGGGPGGGQ